MTTQEEQELIQLIGQDFSDVDSLCLNLTAKLSTLENVRLSAPFC